MTPDFYPTVIAESVYGSFDVAIDHLNRKLIATRNPEEIRGGGLLKYCNLVVRHFRQVMILLMLWCSNIHDGCIFVSNVLLLAKSYRPTLLMLSKYAVSAYLAQNELVAPGDCIHHCVCVC